MSNIDITTTGSGGIAVSCPYNADFVAGAKRLGGKWKGGAWVFDTRDEERVRDLLRTVYGTDGAPVDTVDVRITIRASANIDPARRPSDQRPSYSSELWFAGRQILRRRSRDSAVELGKGVVLLSGRFWGSGGSAKYPDIGDPHGENDVVLEVRDVPAGHEDLAPKEWLQVLETAAPAAEAPAAPTQEAIIDGLVAALKVLTLDASIRAWLEANDPKALAQAEAALAQAGH